MKRAAVPSILVAVVLLAVAVIAEAEQPKNIPRIGYLTGTSAPTITTPDLNADAFRHKHPFGTAVHDLYKPLHVYTR
jgi:hypothetical protein